VCGQYVGLLVFCGYVIFDTQVMVESAAMGSKVGQCMIACGCLSM
jgi:FtsH-binding integral membrane protein